MALTNCQDELVSVPVNTNETRFILQGGVTKPPPWDGYQHAFLTNNPKVRPTEGVFQILPLSPPLPLKISYSMANNVKIIFVAEARKDPVFMTLEPNLENFEKVLGWSGISCQLLVSQGKQGSYSEVIYSVNDANPRGLPFNRSLPLSFDRTRLQPFYGPFVILATTHGIPINLQTERYQYWINFLLLN